MQRTARINVTLVLILLFGAAGLGIGAVALRNWRSTHMAALSLREAEQAFAAGDFDTAAKRYHDYLGRHPQDVAVLEKWALANLQARPREAKHLTKAVQAYRELLRLKPGEEKYLLPLVRLHARAYDAPDQLAYWARQWHDAHPGSRQASLWLGRALTRLGQFDEARELLQGLADAPEPPEDAFILRALLEQEAEPGPEGRTKALAAYDAGIERRPDSAKLYAYRARFLARHEHQIDEARADLERAEQLHPAGVTLHLRLFDEWSEIGEIDRAEAHLNAARQAPVGERLASIASEVVVDIGEEPESWDIFLLRADVKLMSLKLAQRREPREAAGRLADAAMEKCSLMVGREREYLPALVKLYAQAGRGADAQKCADAFRQAVDPASSTVAMQRAVSADLDAEAALIRGDYHAVIALPEYVELAPRILLQKAVALQAIGQLYRAADAVKRYLDAAPADPQGLLRHAIILSELSKWPEALKAARELERYGAYRDEARWLGLRAEVAMLTADDAKDVQRLEELRLRIAEERRIKPRDLSVRLVQAALENNIGEIDAAEQALRQAVGDEIDVQGAVEALARFLARRGRADEAMTAVREALQTQPEHAALWLMLADLYEQNGRIEDARQAIAQLTTLAESTPPARADAMVAGATFELRHGDAARGLQILEDLRRADPREARCRALLLEALLDDDASMAAFDPAAAQALIDELTAIESDANGVRWRYYQARSWLRTEPEARASRIETLLLECVQRDPSFVAAAGLLGRLLEKRGDVARAEAIYRRVFTTHTRAVEIGLRLLDLLQAQQRFTEAAQVADLLETAGQPVEGERLEIALGADRPEEATKILTDYVAAHPNDATARLLLAQLLFAGGVPYDQVARTLDEAERLRPGFANITLARTRMLEAERRFDEAEALCDRAIETANDYAAHLIRGQFLFRRGRLAEAERDFARLREFPDNPAEGCFLLGRFYAETDRAGQSIRVLEDCQADMPDSLLLRQGLIEVLLSSPQAEDRKRGAALLDDSLTQHARDPLLRLMRAALLHERGDDASVAEAMTLLDGALADRPTLLQAHLLRIQIVRERQGDQRAMDLCREALANPRLRKNSSLRLVQADIERRRGNVVQARVLAEDIAARDADFAPARVLLGDLARMEGRLTGPKGALEWLEAAVRVEPDNAEARVKLASARQEAGQTQQAITELSDYVSSRGEACSQRILTVLADLFLLDGQTDEAQAWLDRAAAKAPQSSDVLLVTARLLARRQRYDELQAFLDKCRGEQAGSTRLYLEGANLLAATGAAPRLASARNLFENVAKAEPANHEAWLGLATVAYLLGDRKAALAAYERVLTGEPRNVDHLVQALNGKAWLLFEEGGDLQMAEDLAERAASLAPANLEVLDTRASILERRGDLKRARADFERCALLAEQELQRTAWGKALVNLGRVLLAAGEKEAALSRLEQAQALHAESPCLSEGLLKELDELLARAAG